MYTGSYNASPHQVTDNTLAQLLLAAEERHKRDLKMADDRFERAEARHREDLKIAQDRLERAEDRAEARRRDDLKIAEDRAEARLNLAEQRLLDVEKRCQDRLDAADRYYVLVASSRQGDGEGVKVSWGRETRKPMECKIRRSKLNYHHPTAEIESRLIVECLHRHDEPV